MTTGHEHELLTRYFDGEIDYTDLPEELKREAREFHRAMDLLAAEQVRAPATLKPAVMDRVRAAGRPAVRRLFEWLVTPRALGLRPVTAGSAVAVAAVLIVVLWRSSDAPSSPAVVPAVVATVERDTAVTPEPPDAPSDAAVVAEPSRLTGRVSAETLEALQPVLAAAERDSLPLAVLERRALEGAAKGHATSEIVAAVDQLAGQLRSARALLWAADATRHPSEAELAAAAQALALGVTPERLTELARGLSPGERLDVPFALMGDLVARGITAADAQGVVTHIVALDVPEARVLQITPQLDLALRVETRPRVALSQALQGLGIPEPAGRPDIRQ